MPMAGGGWSSVEALLLPLDGPADGGPSGPAYMHDGGDGGPNLGLLPIDPVIGLPPGGNPFRGDPPEWWGGRPPAGRGWPWGGGPGPWEGFPPGVQRNPWMGKPPWPPLPPGYGHQPPGPVTPGMPGLPTSPNPPIIMNPGPIGPNNPGVQFEFPPELGGPPPTVRPVPPGSVKLGGGTFDPAPYNPGDKFMHWPSHPGSPPPPAPGSPGGPPEGWTWGPKPAPNVYPGGVTGYPPYQAYPPGRGPGGALPGWHYDPGAPFGVAPDNPGVGMEPVPPVGPRPPVEGPPGFGETPPGPRGAPTDPVPPAGASWWYRPVQWFLSPWVQGPLWILTNPSNMQGPAWPGNPEYNHGLPFPHELPPGVPGPPEAPELYWVPAPPWQRGPGKPDWIHPHEVYPAPPPPPPDGNGPLAPWALPRLPRQNPNTPVDPYL